MPTADGLDSIGGVGDLIGEVVRDVAGAGRALLRSTSLAGPARVVVDTGLAAVMAGGDPVAPVPALSAWADPGDEEIDAYLACAAVLLRRTRRLAASADLASTLAYRLRRRRAEQLRHDLDGYALLFAELGAAEAARGDQASAVHHLHAATRCQPLRAEIRADVITLRATTHALAGRTADAVGAAAAAERLIAGADRGWLTERVGRRLATVRDLIALSLSIRVAI